MDFDHLKKKKKIIIEYNDIKEVINRTFFYSWTSLEIFMKNGKSYLFNFFNEETNKDVLNLFKTKKIQVIRDVNEYFKKEEFSKKWKEGKISTFDYLLLLNKLSSRTYNDPNQYLIMPWIFLQDGINSKRDFDLPISMQDKDIKEKYLAKKEKNFVGDNSPTQGNHYSTSAYIYFYLMRTNPFTNDMIKFQSNNFDLPERQYTDIKHTLYLCQRMGNNREIIPELFYLPEMYINLNDNDFGRQKGFRVHNINFDIYAKNPIEFCYILKKLINNDPDINNHIHQWFDFIFGITQIGINPRNNTKEEKIFQMYRKFNKYSYGQYYNIKKIISEAKKRYNDEKAQLNEIKTTIAISINFGQSPYQLLTEMHPSKNIIINKEKELEDMSTPNGEIDKIITFDENYIKGFFEIKSKNEIIYFTKSYNNNDLYCLINNMDLEIYKNKNNELIKTLSPKTQFLPFSKTQKGNFIFHPKYIFCDLGNYFIFCRTFDKTLRYFHNDNEKSILLKSYITCIKKINNNEFITGHDNGKICKWRFNLTNEDDKEELILLLIIKSNRNAITCLNFNEKLNIIISCDLNTIMIRKNYDFEYLVSFEIENKEQLKKSIIDIKISDYDFIYVSLYIEDNDAYELQGFTLNGNYFGKYNGCFSNFEISQTGKIIIGDINKQIIRILNPINFEEIFSQIIVTNNEGNCFHFHFEKPNIIYYGIKDKNESKIIIIYLEEKDEKKFL